MRNVKVILFDLGRVLVGIDPGRPGFAALMRSFGINPAEAFGKFRFTPEVRRHMTGEMDSISFYRSAVERFGLDHTYDQFAAGWCDLFQPEPGMREIFDAAALRYRVGILSDTDPLHWAAISRLMPWLDRAIPTLSYQVGYLKPHPSMYETAAAACGFPPDECLFIDDLEENVDGARFNGMPAIPFSGAGKLRRDLRGLGIL